MGGLRFADGTGPGDRTDFNFRHDEPVFLTFDGLWFQRLPRYYYATTIEFDPRGRLFRPPSRYGIFRFGFVLNVMYESIHVEYENTEPMRQVWRRPILDTAAEPPNRPFVHDPAEMVARLPMIVEGHTRVVEVRDTIRPGIEIFYGPSGFGDLLDPWSAEGYVPRSDQRIRFSYIDQPRIAVPQRFGGERLHRLEQVVVFRFWVVAMPASGGSVEVLAHSPEFSLQAWLETQPSSLRSLEPQPAFMCEGLPGRWTRPFASIAEAERAARGVGNLQPRPGPGPVAPITTGTTANDRLIAWVTAQGIAPRDPSETTHR